jgi:diguanylate cyclase (GGDEF)-like protein/PAS domain S-box-containing protein
MRLANISLATRITLLGVSLVVAGGLLWIANENERLQEQSLNERVATLDATLRGERERMQMQIDALRRDTLFLSNTPPVSGIARAVKHGGIDPRARNSRAEWERRLQEIFSAFLNANPDYYQACYIGLADGGRELVRVERQAGGIVVARHADLQRKGDRDYFKAGLVLEMGKVHLSNFSLNQKHGRIEVPHRPSVRAVISIFDERGQRFGMLVLNLDASNLFKPLRQVPLAGVQTFIADQHGHYLLHPDDRRAFAFELGAPADDIRRDIPQLASYFGAAAVASSQSHPSANARDGYLTVQRLNYDESDPSHFLLLAYHLPQSVLDDGWAGIPRRSLLTALGLTLLAAVVFMLMLHHLLRPLRHITQAASEIAAHRRSARLYEMGGGEIGELVQALNGMMDALSGQEALARENAFRQELIESLPGVFYMLDEHGYFLMWNHNFETVLARAEKGLAGLNALDLFAGSDKLLIESRMTEVFVTGESSAEAGLVTPSGVIPFHFTGRRVLRDGKPVLIGLGLDISEQRVQLQQIEAQLKRNMALRDNSMEGVHVMDAEGDVLEVNEAFCRMLGYTVEEMKHLNVRDWDDQFTSEELGQRFREMVGHSATFETVHRRKDGSLLQVEVCATGVEVGGKVYLYAASRDITERKRMQESLLRRHRVIETAMDGYWMTTGDGFLQETNAAYARMSGYSQQELVGMHISQLEASERPEDVRGHMEKIIAQGYDRFETRHRHKSGRVIDIEVSVTYTDGYFYVFCHDISQRKQHASQLAHQQLVLQEAQRLGQLGSWELDLASDELTWSDEAYHIFEQDKAVARDLLAIFDASVHPDDRERVEQAYQRALLDREPYDIEHRLLLPDSRIKWVREHCYTLYDDAGKPLRSIGMVQDITDRKHIEERLRVAAVAFETMDGILITDERSNIQRVNRAFERITGYRQWEVQGLNPRLLGSGLHDAAFYKTMWEQLLQDGGWSGEIWDRRKSGEVYPKWMTITAVKDEQGKVTNYVAIFSDITDRKRHEEEIRNMAFYDALTQLPNRRLFLDRLQSALSASARNSDFGALLFIDLDRFKVLNDTLGHDYGDLLLKEVAKRIKECVREVDTVARLGGDEFVVVLEGVGGDREDASHKSGQVAEKIRESLSRPYLLKEHEHYSSPSIGVELFHDGGESVDELIKHADVAMYQAKSAGRNTVRFYDPSLQHDLDTRAMLENDLRRAIEGEGLQLYYQVQVDNARRIIGVEALLRWQHQRHGMVSPVRFIPVAEESLMIIDLGDWVLNHACAQLVRWSDDPHMAGLVMAVNVSAHQFAEQDFVTNLEVILKRHGVDPRRLKLELTEGVVLNDIAEVVAKMDALNALGVLLSLDDFGTGYSSLTYLKQLPIGQLKIDQSFVRDITTDSGDAGMVRSIIDMAKNFGHDVIAEGVETEAQLDFLKQHGCMAYQGYYFGKPVPLEELERIVATWQAD